jgi:hypothetical protein
MLSATIDAMVERDVVKVDISGAFMQADIDEVMHVIFEVEIAKMLVRMDPKLYWKYIRDDNGKAVLYVELLKALYGTLRAALLFWKLLSRKLILWGFTINPYDWCVTNKMIDGKQCTVLWHVDDLKISQVCEDVNTDIIKKINDEFGKEAPVTITMSLRIVIISSLNPFKELNIVSTVSESLACSVWNFFCSRSISSIFTTGQLARWMLEFAKLECGCIGNVFAQDYER